MSSGHSNVHWTACRGIGHVCVMADSVVLWHGIWHGIAYCISGMVLCILCGLEPCGKIQLQCFIMSGVW